MQRKFGGVGFYFTSVIGGPMSGASAVAAAAALAGQGDVALQDLTPGFALASSSVRVVGNALLLRRWRLSLP